MLINSTVMAFNFNVSDLKRKVPIKRNNKFFSGEDFNLEMEYMSEYMEQDANQTVVLYQVDYEKTKVNDVYKEADRENIRFKFPVEITVVYELQDAETKAYKDNLSKGIYVKPGKLVFSVLLKELEEKKCDISRGDFIGVQITSDQMMFFTVADDGRMASSSNKHMLYGTQAFYRTITASPVDLVDFQG